MLNNKQHQEYQEGTIIIKKEALHPSHFWSTFTTSWRVKCSCQQLQMGFRELLKNYVHAPSTAPRCIVGYSPKLADVSDQSQHLDTLELTGQYNNCCIFKRQLQQRAFGIFVLLKRSIRNERMTHTFSGMHTWLVFVLMVHFSITWPDSTPQTLPAVAHISLGYIDDWYWGNEKNYGEQVDKKWLPALDSLVS